LNLWETLVVEIAKSRSTNRVKIGKCLIADETGNVKAACSLVWLNANIKAKEQKWRLDVHPVSAIMYSKELCVVTGKQPEHIKHYAHLRLLELVLTSHNTDVFL
jgi:hypothetical protein